MLAEQDTYLELNIHAAFDQMIRSELGHYVYALLDPTEGRQIFYVGVGGGKEALGNERVLHHFRETKEFIAGKRTASNKVKRIAAIWAKGKEVEWVILRRKLPSEMEARRLEAILIDVFRNCGVGQLQNVQGGTHSKDEGYLTREELLVRASPAFDPLQTSEALRNRPIMLVNISKTYTSGEDAFLATSRAWKIGKNWQSRSDMIVVGLVNQVALTAYAADGWALCAPGRYEFREGKLVDEDRKSLGHLDF